MNKTHIIIILAALLVSGVIIIALIPAASYSGANVCDQLGKYAMSATDRANMKAWILQEYGVTCP